MRNGSRTFEAIALTLAAPVLLGAGEAGSVDVDIAVTDLRNTRGVVMACMTSNPQTFPRCRDDTQSYRVTVPAGERVSLHFAGVKPGTYAIALLHDENRNGKSDRALTMIPKEGYGFSRDAPVRMGPPEFDEAAFRVGSAPVHQTIRMRYWL